MLSIYVSPSLFYHEFFLNKLFTFIASVTFVLYTPQVLNCKPVSKDKIKSKSLLLDFYCSP